MAAVMDNMKVKESFYHRRFVAGMVGEKYGNPGDH